MAFTKTCRRAGCSAHVEIEAEDHWSSQCRWHNDEDAAQRQEYREDEARYREEMEGSDADD
jgi:hypothetical protein